VKVLFDTDILIDYLDAVPEAQAELRRYGPKAISIRASGSGCPTW